MRILYRFHGWLIFARVIALFMFVWPYIRPHILCTQLVICLLSHFIHIWYHGWPWSEHAHIIPISTLFTLLNADLGSITFKCNQLHYNYFSIFMITLHYITITSFFKCNRLHYNYFVNVINYRAHTTLKSEGEVTSFSGADKKEVRDNREKWWGYREKSKYFFNCTTFHIRGALSWHSYIQ
jgi:hypothetical protein